MVIVFAWLVPYWLVVLGGFAVRCGLFIVIFCYAFCRCSSLLGFEFVGYCVCVWLYL